MSGAFWVTAAPYYMTLNREQNVVAWHAHRLEHGRILSVASLRGSRNTPDEEVWFAVARGEGEGEACITLECMADGNDCLDACTEAVVKGDAVRPEPFGGMRRLSGGRGRRMHGHQR